MPLWLAPSHKTETFRSGRFTSSAATSFSLSESSPPAQDGIHTLV